MKGVFTNRNPMWEFPHHLPSDLSLLILRNKKMLSKISKKSSLKNYLSMTRKAKNQRKFWKQVEISLHLSTVQAVNNKYQNQLPEVLYVKKLFLETSQNSQENNCTRVSFLMKLPAWGLQLCIKKETLAQAFSCEFCGISKNTLFTKHLW